MKLSVNSPIAVKDLDLTQGRINTISISEKSDFQRISLLKCEIKLWLVLPNKLCAGLHKFRFEDFETFEKCSYYPVCIKYSREKKNCDIKFLQHSRPIFPKAGICVKWFDNQRLFIHSVNAMSKYGLYLVSCFSGNGIPVQKISVDEIWSGWYVENMVFLMEI